ncbi:MAG: hypothetical protein IKN03_06960 [Fibrobacter sp.]|nr:hypothetical protein [Fibrobacter sp.]MBR6855119.1 hypothetical protein [Fibrobacter sp.]
MAQHNLSKIVDDNGDEYLIKAKGLEDQVQISLTGDVSGSATTDFTSDPSISTIIGTKKVTTSKIDDSAVTTDKINDKAVTLDKIADAAKGGAVQDNDGVLATHAQVKDYVDAIAAGEGKYRGVQTVATINSWTVANLNNGDRVITADAGTITFNGQSLAVVADQELVLWKDTSTNPVTAVWQTSEGNYKLKQTAKTDPTASGTTLTAIATISQDSNGDITATKKTIQSATTSQQGVVQLAGSIGATVSSENNKAASEKAVRDAINALDVSNITANLGASKTISALSETDGKISATATPIQITESQVTNLTTDLGNKADKVANATSGNFASLDENGNLTDSGKKASDFATSAQGGKADSAIQGVKLNGASSALTPDSNKVVTIPDAIATGTTGATNGLMTAADKQKLNGIASGAEVNQNAFSNVKVGSTTVAADTKTDTLELVAGGATTITPDATNDKITISSTDQSVTAVGNHYAPATDSSAEKDASGGAATQLPTASTGTLVQVVTGVQMDAKGHVTGVVSKGLWSPNNTYSNASLGQGYGTCATAEATVTKVVTLSGYALTVGGIVAVKFTYGLCATAALNINSKGAKKIFIDGAAVTETTAKRVLAGDIAYFIYDGTNYQFLGTDKAERKFDINYRASDNALVFTKKFGTAS